MTDALTGLPTHRDLTLSAFDGDVSAVFVDIDGLIWLNEANGHEAGDRAITTIAEAIAQRAAKERGASAYRVGGDEFLIVLQQSDLAAAEALAGAIVGDVRGLRIPYARGDHPGRTILEVNAVAMRLAAAALPRYFAAQGATEEFRNLVWPSIDAARRRCLQQR
jgi:diguanylate cyclase (GGDEF)-like protein